MDGRTKIVKISPKSSPFKKNMCFKCSIYNDFSGCASWTYRRDKNGKMEIVKINLKSSTLFENMIAKSLF